MDSIVGKRFVLGLVFGVAALVALALPASAVAAVVSSSYSIHGYEYYATSTEGRFTGTATGSSGDGATWQATVDHTPLTTTATITGGTAYLVTSRLVTIHGQFTGGSVTLAYQASGCGNQVYSVVGALGSVTRSDSSAVGSGSFRATLTHYRYSVFGSCVVYSASVSGTISLSF